MSVEILIGGFIIGITIFLSPLYGKFIINSMMKMVVDKNEKYVPRNVYEVCAVITILTVMVIVLTIIIFVFSLF